MSKRMFSHLNWTPGATADGSTLAAGFMALKGGSGTMLMDILEVSAEGLAGASNPCPLVLAYNSTIGTTPTALATPDADGFLDATASALSTVPVAYVAAATAPTRSNSTTSPKLTLGMNAFGGIYKWSAGPGQQMTVLGNTASLGEVSLSCFTGGTPGLIQSHILYEPH